MAAGKGTRLGGSVPKPLTSIEDESILTRVINTANKLNPDKIVVVVGHRSEEVILHVRTNLANIINTDFALQESLNGTLGAVAASISNIPKESELLLILPSDNGWFLKKETLEELLKTHLKEQAVVSILLSREFNEGLHKIEYHTNEKKVLGIRLRTDKEGGDDTYLAGTGILCINKDFFIENKHLIPQLPNGEYTVSRIIEVAFTQNKNVAYEIVDSNEILTINTPEDLERLKLLSQ